MLSFRRQGQGRAKNASFKGRGRAPRPPPVDDWVSCIASPRQGNRLWDAGALEVTAYGRPVNHGASGRWSPRKIGLGAVLAVERQDLESFAAFDAHSAEMALIQAKYGVDTMSFR